CRPSKDNRVSISGALLRDPRDIRNTCLKRRSYGLNANVNMLKKISVGPFHENGCRTTECNAPGFIVLLRKPEPDGYPGHGNQSSHPLSLKRLSWQCQLFFLCGRA